LKNKKTSLLGRVHAWGAWYSAQGVWGSSQGLKFYKQIFLLKNNIEQNMITKF